MDAASRSDRTVALIESTAQPPDDHTARTFVGCLPDRIVHLQEQAREIVVPIEQGHLLRRNALRSVGLDRLRARLSELVSIVELRRERANTWGEIGGPMNEAVDRGLLPVYDEEAMPDRQALVCPLQQLGAVRMPRLEVERADARANFKRQTAVGVAAGQGGPSSGPVLSPRCSGLLRSRTGACRRVHRVASEP